MVDGLAKTGPRPESLYHEQSPQPGSCSPERASLSIERSSLAMEGRGRQRKRAGAETARQGVTRARRPHVTVNNCALWLTEEELQALDKRIEGDVKGAGIRPDEDTAPGLSSSQTVREDHAETGTEVRFHGDTEQLPGHKGELSVVVLSPFPQSFQILGSCKLMDSIVRNGNMVTQARRVYNL